MPSDTLNHAADETAAAKQSASEAVDHGQRAFKDAMASAEKTFIDATRSAEKMLKEGVDTLLSRAKPYTENAGQHVDEAQRYVVERVKERPMTATLAGLGVGLLIGALLASRGK